MANVMLHGEVEAIGILLQSGRDESGNSGNPEEDAGRLAAGEYRLIKESAQSRWAVYFTLT